VLERAKNPAAAISDPLPEAYREGAQMLTTTQMSFGQLVLMTNGEYWRVSRIRDGANGSRTVVLKGRAVDDVVRVTVNSANFSAKIWRASA
jgi:hypothetical protein